VLYFGDDNADIKALQTMAVENMKRVCIREDSDYFDTKHETPYYILDFQETKTTWHPIEQIGAKGSGY